MMKECLHRVTEIRKRKVGGGGIQVREQCCECGASLGNALKQAGLDLEVLPWWDEDLKEEYWNREREEREHARRMDVQRNERQETEWWREYSEYLETTEWKSLRNKVLRRAGGRCEGCMDQEAVQVHHLTYKHVGAELLFELVAVCEDCHKRVHPHMEGEAS